MIIKKISNNIVEMPVPSIIFSSNRFTRIISSNCLLIATDDNIRDIGAPT